MATITEIVKKPAPKTVKCKTPFLERNGDDRHYLGNPRWATPPSLPRRERCWRDVLDAERAEGLRLVAVFRQNEELERENDIGAITGRITQLDGSRMPAHHDEAQNLRAKREKCDHQQWLIAVSNLRELRASAYDLSKVILERLVDSFNDELNGVALDAEKRLTDAGIPLSNPEGNDWELWHSVEVTWRHSWKRGLPAQVADA